MNHTQHESLNRSVDQELRFPCRQALQEPVTITKNINASKNINITNNINASKNIEINKSIVINKSNTARETALNWAKDNKEKFIGAAMSAAMQTIQKHHEDEAKKGKKAAE